MTSHRSGKRQVNIWADAAVLCRRIHAWFELDDLPHGIHGDIPDSKVHGASMGPIWGRQDPGGSHVGPANFAIWYGTGSTLAQVFNMNQLTYRH